MKWRLISLAGIEEKEIGTIEAPDIGAAIQQCAAMAGYANDASGVLTMCNDWGRIRVERVEPVEPTE